MRWSATHLAHYQLQRKSRGQVQQELSLPEAAASRKRRELGPKESAIHIAVAEHLRRRGTREVVWWHTPNGEHRDPRTAQKLRAMGVAAGIPDIALVISGRLHWLELKRERGGYLSAAQKKMQRRLRASGCVVATARGVDQALATLNAWGAFGPGNPTKGSLDVE